MDLYPFIVLQLSFQMWTNQIQDTLNFKKHGDSAFHARDFSTGINYYTQVSQQEFVGIGIHCIFLQYQGLRRNYNHDDNHNLEPDQMFPLIVLQLKKHPKCRLICGQYVTSVITVFVKREFTVLVLCSSSMVGPWYRQLCMLGAVYAT